MREDTIEYGFVWHTTGSGKTLTSFKASTLLKENDSIHKCVFIMDREEFSKFQEKFVEESNEMELVNNARLLAGEKETRYVA